MRIQRVGRGTNLGIRRAALLIVAAMALAACAVVDPPDLPPGGDPGRRVAELPIPPEQQELARSFTAVRGWDLCAMHDIPAATEITGFEPEALEPGTDECTLSLGAPGQVELRALTIAVSRILPPDQRQPFGDDPCSHVHPLMPGADVPWGIEVSWSPRIGGYPSSLEKPPCDVVRDYVTAIRPKLTAPPLRSAGLTSPALALAGLDPCAVVAELLTAASGGTVLTADNSNANVHGPSRCAGSLSTGLLQEIYIEVEFDVDATYAASGSHSVAGRPADISPGHWLLGGCRAAFRATDTAVKTFPSDVPTVEIMTIELDSCNGEQQVAELAERAARLVPPAPPVNRDAQPLGDLDPPPSPHDLGAPFDPCTTPGWPGYPGYLRPEPPPAPTPIWGGPADQFAVGCRFSAGDLRSALVWGLPTGEFTADPAARPGSTPTQFGDEPGIEHRSALPDGRPHCYSALELSDGIAAMHTTLPDGDPCSVNREVLSGLAAAID